MHITHSEDVKQDIYLKKQSVLLLLFSVKMADIILIHTLMH